MLEINPFDILSGKVVQNELGTFWFKEPGNNLQFDGWPIFENLHRLDGPAMKWRNGSEELYIDGIKHTHRSYRHFKDKIKCQQK